MYGVYWLNFLLWIYVRLCRSSSVQCSSCSILLPFFYCVHFPFSFLYSYLFPYSLYFSYFQLPLFVFLFFRPLQLFIVRQTQQNGVAGPSAFSSLVFHRKSCSSPLVFSLSFSLVVFSLAISQLSRPPLFLFPFYSLRFSFDSSQ